MAKTQLLHSCGDRLYPLWYHIYNLRFRIRNASQKIKGNGGRNSWKKCIAVLTIREGLKYDFEIRIWNKSTWWHITTERNKIHACKFMCFQYFSSKCRRILHFRAYYIYVITRFFLFLVLSIVRLNIREKVIEHLWFYCIFFAISLAGLSSKLCKCKKYSRKMYYRERKYCRQGSDVSALQTEILNVMYVWMSYTYIYIFVRCRLINILYVYN